MSAVVEKWVHVCLYLPKTDLPSGTRKDSWIIPLLFRIYINFYFHLIQKFRSTLSKSTITLDPETFTTKESSGRLVSSTQSPEVCFLSSYSIAEVGKLRPRGPNVALF